VTEWHSVQYIATDGQTDGRTQSLTGTATDDNTQTIPPSLNLQQNNAGDLTSGAGR